MLHILHFNTLFAALISESAVMTLKRTRESHFKPTNFELLNILQGRIVRNKRCNFITDMQNLYEREPWLLQHVRHVKLKENEWFYFVRRNKRPGLKKADTKRPSRKVGESGIWKTTGTVIQIKNQDGVILGSMRHISFKANSETVKDGITVNLVTTFYGKLFCVIQCQA